MRVIFTGLNNDRLAAFDKAGLFEVIDEKDFFDSIEDAVNNVEETISVVFI